MQKTRLLVFALLLFSSCLGLAQNGVTLINLPAPYNPQVLRSKNCLAVDPGGRVWLGFRDIGVGVWDGTTWTVYDNSTGFLPNNDVRSIAFDRSGGIWVGTNTGGAARFDGVNWQLFDMASAGLPDNHIDALLTVDSLMWLGTNAGIAVQNGTGWTVFTAANSALASDTIQALTRDRTGAVWAATTGGLCRFNGTAWQTEQVGNFTSVNCDSSGVVFASTATTIWQQTPAGFQTLNTLYPSNNFNYTGAPSMTGSNSGIWFGQPGLRLFNIDSGRVNVFYPGNLVNTDLPCAPSDSGLFFVNAFTTLVNTGSMKLMHLRPDNYNGLGLGLTPSNIRALNINQVNATLLNIGDLSWNTVTGPGYEVPKGSGVHALFSSALWIGGLDTGNNLHLSAMTYRQTGVDFFPGPLDTTNATTTAAAAWPFDRIWIVDRVAISELQWRFANGQLYSNGYQVPADIREWPAHGTGNQSRRLAPFVDANGDGLYSVDDGDYPDITGDQYAWWVFNDALDVHTETGGAPLGLEIHGEAWAFTCPQASDSEQVINYTTFYRFTIINRSGMNYHNVRTALHQDTDLGNWQDDWIGCSPSGNYSCAMNGDADDSDPSYANYGLYPPQQATVFLDGPLAVPGDNLDNNNNGSTDEPNEHNRLTSMLLFGPPAPFTPFLTPGIPDDYWNYLNLLWPDSTPLTEGAYGYGGTVPTRFLFPDRPQVPNGWSEAALNYPGGDRRMLNGCGLFDLAAGDTATLTFAFVTVFDSLNPWGTAAYYDGLDSATKQVERWYFSNSAPSCPQLFNAVPEVAAAAPQLFLAPNPAQAQLSVRHPFGHEPVVVEITDMTGRIVHQSTHSGTTFMLPLNQLPTGLFLVRVQSGNESATARFVHY